MFINLVATCKTYISQYHKQLINTEQNTLENLKILNFREQLPSFPRIFYWVKFPESL